MKAPCGGILLDEAIFEIAPDRKTITIKGGGGDITTLTIRVNEIDNRLEVIEGEVEDIEQTTPISNQQIEAMFNTTYANRLRIAKQA